MKIDAFAQAVKAVNLSNNLTSQTNPKNSFGEIIMQTALPIKDKIEKAEHLSSRHLKGEIELESVVTAIAEAEVALKSANTIRDKIIESYQEIIRMPI